MIEKAITSPPPLALYAVPLLAVIVLFDMSTKVPVALGDTPLLPSTISELSIDTIGVPLAPVAAAPLPPDADMSDRFILILVLLPASMPLFVTSMICELSTATFRVPALVWAK